MFILAGIREGTPPFPFLKVLAWNLLQCRIVLLNELFLLRTGLHQVFAGDNQEGVLPAKGTAAVILHRCALTSSGSPRPDTLETEGVITAIQNPELLPIRPYSLHTDSALGIVAPHRLDSSLNLMGDRVQNDFLVELPIFQLLVVLEHVRPVTIRSTLQQKPLKVVQKADLVKRQRIFQQVSVLG
jgi:hypothetical protein